MIPVATCNDKCFVKCPVRLADKIFINRKSKPNCKFLFTTLKLGKPIWKQPPTNDFTFHNRESSAEYNALRDPNLKTFFMRKANLLRLREKNLITDKNEVVCSSKEFNDYRKMMHRLATERHAHQQKALAADELDDHRVKLSNAIYESIERKQQRLARAYDPKKVRCASSGTLTHASVVEMMKRKKLEQEQARMEKFKAKVEEYNQRLCKIQELDRMKRKIVKERSVYKKMDVANKRAFVEEKLRSFQAKTRIQIAAHDKKFKENMAKKLRDRPKSCCMIVRCPMGVL